MVVRNTEEKRTMRKLLVALVSGLFATVAFAEPQVNRDGDYCHIPLSNFDANDEASVGPPDCNLAVVEAGGEADGYCACAWEDVPPEVLEDVNWTHIVYKGDKTIYKVKVKYKKLQEPCVLTAAGGDAYNSTDWKSKVKYNPDTGDLKALLVCLDGQPQ